MDVLVLRRPTIFRKLTSSEVLVSFIPSLGHPRPRWSYSGRHSGHTFTYDTLKIAPTSKLIT